MRGKVVRAIPDILRKRITPAYAGKSSRHGGQSKRTGDHPRLCGEKPCGAVCFRFTLRITPAYAGKRFCWSLGTCRHGDHPRLCGEKEFARFVHQLTSGSPPPMRGKEIAICKPKTKNRITPAYAGKSGKFPCPVWVTGDHPRLCGEKGTVGKSLRCRLGSPPPMRGKVSSLSAAVV